MPIRRMAISGTVALAFVAGGAALAFDASSPSADIASADAFKVGIASYRAGDALSAVEALSFAAENGSTGAQWKLGLMYAEGDGVERDEVRAYELLNEVANTRIGDDDIRHPRSTPYVLDALVRMGALISRGIPNSDVKADPLRARMYYERAAVYGKAAAQFRLAQMYYRGEGGERAPHQAAKWAKLSMDKGNNNARALLGHLLFEGDGVTRQPSRGLTFLTIALGQSGPDDVWIRRLHEQALSVATDAVWAQARKNADAWRESGGLTTTVGLAPIN